MHSILPADCARARQQVSLRLDSELSEFQLVLLEAHLARCEDCRAFAQGITGLTEAIRAVPLERAWVSFQPPHRRGRLDALAAGSLRAGSAAAAIVVVAVTGVIGLKVSRPDIAGVDAASARSVLDLHERQLARLDGFVAARVSEVPRGLAAAENAALRAPTSFHRPQGRR